MKIKVSNVEMHRLYEALDKWEYNPKFSSRHNELLQEHRCELMLKAAGLLRKQQGSYRVELSSLQALAFMQIFDMHLMPIDATHYTVLEIIGLIDKESKEPKTIPV